MFVTGVHRDGGAAAGADKKVCYQFRPLRELPPQWLGAYSD
jgi:hypothetical protein